MNNQEAIVWLEQIKDIYIRGGDEDFDRRRKEAIDMAIKALQGDMYCPSCGVRLVAENEYIEPINEQDDCIPVSRSDEYRKGFNRARMAFEIEYARESESMRRKNAELEVRLYTQRLLLERLEWIPVSKDYPKDLEEVNVTWVNHNPPVYYEHEKDKPHTGFAVRYNEKWYWWDSTIVDALAEYGSRDFIEPIDKDVEITAWKPPSDPYKGGEA